MKRKIIALLFLLMGCTFLNAAPYSEKIKELLVRLDSLIAQKNTFAMLKEAKIAQLHKLRKDVRTLEERYWLNKNLYDEYCVYNADSAMNYVAGNLDIVYKQNDKYRQMEWKIKKSFLLAATDKCCICIRISISIPVVKWVLCMNIMHSWSVFTRTL